MWGIGTLIVFLSMFCIFSFILKLLKQDDASRFIGSFVISLIILVALFYVDMSNQKYEYYNTRNIVAMQDNQVYVVSRDNVDSGMKYYYMYEVGGKAYLSGHAPSNRSIIHLSEKDYKVDIYKKQKKVKFFKLFLPQEYVDAYMYDFYIPKDGLISDFNIDLK